MRDKQFIEERIDAFEQLFEEDEFVRKQRMIGERIGFSKGKEEGKEEGLIEGEIQATQCILVDFVSRRYPDLRGIAQQKAARTKSVDALYEVIGLLSVAPSEDMARFILTTPPAA